MKRFIVILFGILLSAISYADTCTQSQIDLGNGECVESKFEITTVNMPANTTFKFAMSATGTFYIDWGDGDTDSIQRTDTTETLYEHEYTTSGPKTIRMAGKATYYNTTNNATTAVAAIRFGYEDPNSVDTTPDLVASINGSIGEIFSSGPNWGQTPIFHFTFARTNITSIPENLFSGVERVSYGTFRHTFYNCVSLQSIPEGLFKNAYGDNHYVFKSTFENCRALTSIPEKLFENRKGYALEFYLTFSGCTGLTSLPEHLFASIKNAQGSMFFETFQWCTNLSGYIPPSMFAGLIENGSPTADRLWFGTFYKTNLATTCPAGTTQYITGYESEWDGKVSCVEDAPHVCSAGEYLPKMYNSCAVCPAGKYCTGGTFNFSASTTQGLSGNITAGYFGNGGTKTATPTSEDCLSGYTCGTCRGQTGSNGRPLYTDAGGGASACSECPAVSGEFASRATGRYGYYPSSRNNGINGCLASFNDADDDATFSITCYYHASYNNYGNGECHIYEPTACAAGRYDTIRQNTEWRRYGDNAAGCTTGVDCMNGKVCTATDPGYYSPDGATTQTPCASGTYSPSGSAVCYPHILHVGNDNIYLRSTKLTTPSVNIQIGNDIFYANMTTTPTYMNKDSSHYLHILYEGDDYYVCDDTTYQE